MFSHDDLGRETSRSRTGGPSADTITTSYLKNGSIDTVSRNGQTFDYSYDGANRATSLSGGGSETRWAFEPNGAGEGLLASIQVGTVGMGTTWQQSSFDYYATGQSGGSPGQLKTVDDPFTTGVSTYGYDVAGRVATRTDTAGLTWTRTYEAQTSNPDTQQIVKTGTNPTKTFAYFDLGYDVTGNVSSRTSKLWAAGTTSNPVSTAGDTGTGAWSYFHDGAGRMLSATGPSPTGTSTTWSYAYDGQGNRLSESDGTVTTTYATDAQGWPVTADRSVGNDLTFTHDAEGNLVGIDEAAGTANDLTFGYDSWSGTSSASKGGTSVSYTLDAFGRTAARGSTSYVYQGASEDLVRTDASGTITEYLSTPGGPMATKTGSTTSFYLRDLHGDVVAQIAPGAGTLSSTAYFSPYGERSTLSGSAGLYGYQGDVTDQLTGTVDMLTRNYLPSVGRFTSRDVLQGDPNDPPSLNQFVYATGNPVTYWDPTGMLQAGGEGGGGGNGCDDACQEAQESYCVDHDCGHTDGDGYSPTPTPSDPVPPITLGGVLLVDTVNTIDSSVLSHAGLLGDAALGVLSKGATDAFNDATSIFGTHGFMDGRLAQTLETLADKLGSSPLAKVGRYAGALRFASGALVVGDAINRYNQRRNAGASMGEAYFKASVGALTGPALALGAGALCATGAGCLALGAGVGFAGSLNGDGVADYFWDHPSELIRATPVVTVFAPGVDMAAGTL